MPPRFGGRRCAVSHVVAHTYWLRRGASSYRVSVHLLHSGGPLRWSDLPRIPTPCGQSVQRHHDGWDTPALWSAWSQNESGRPIILRPARPWRWCACLAPPCLCLPHPCRVSLASTQHAASGLCLSARRAMWHKNCALVVSICVCRTGTEAQGVAGQEAPLRHDTQPGLEHLPYAHTAPGDCLVAVLEACLCDGTFSQLLLVYWPSGG